MRIAVLSMHTSPLAQAGAGDSGGMNVYVRELVSSLAQRGATCDVYVRTWRDGLPAEVAVEPGFRVVHVDAGPPLLPKEALPDVVDAFGAGVRDAVLRRGGADVIHANYWLSGVAGHRLKHELDLPLVCTFHTLGRVKADGGDPEPERRIRAELETIMCSDVVLANCEEEAAQVQRLYGALPERLEVVAPGVDHAFFSPGSQAGARAAVGLAPGHPVLLFVGRIQPLKGVDVAVRTLALLPDRRAELVIVGGASGAHGDVELAKVRRLVAELGLTGRVRFVPPQPHHLLASWYRAADVVLVPSRSESFGLVALEAAACGRPVVAAAVGGLLTLVQDGVTGHLVASREAADYAAPVDRLLRDPAHAAAMGEAAAVDARRYTWSGAAAALGQLYAELTARELVACA